MRLAVIADIHGNLSALEAVLDDISAQGTDLTINLGDSVSGPLDPRGTAELLMAQDMPAIIGNHDRWLWDPPGGKPPLWEEWTLPHLDETHIGWLKSLPATQTLGPDDAILACHGTPASDHENWLHLRRPGGVIRKAYLSEIELHARGHAYPVILSAHTHLARAVRLPDGRFLLNPGSVGCPAYLDDRYDPPYVAETGSPEARYAILQQRNGQWTATFHLVPYDPGAMIDRARETGAEGWVEALRTGWVRR